MFRRSPFDHTICIPSSWAKYADNYLSIPFTLGVVLIFLMWLGGNLPTRVDIDRLKRGRGMIGHDHPPAYCFNAGQKLIYWVVVLGWRCRRGERFCADFPVLWNDGCDDAAG